MESDEAVGHEEDCSEGVLVYCWKDDRSEKSREFKMEDLETAVARDTLLNLSSPLKALHLLHDQFPEVKK